MQFEKIQYLEENLNWVLRSYQEEFEETMLKIHQHVKKGTTLYFSQYYFGGGLIKTPYSFAVVKLDPTGKAIVVGILAFTYTMRLNDLDNVQVAKSIRTVLSNEQLEMVQNIELFMSNKMELVFEPSDPALNIPGLEDKVNKNLIANEGRVDWLAGDNPKKQKDAEIFKRVDRARAERGLRKILRHTVKGF